MSPHAAAAIDGVTINLESIKVPATSKNLIIEGAGGLMVLVSNEFLVIDLIEKLKADVILVSRNYLGSINHTLLSVEALQRRNIPIKGIIFNGNLVNASEKFIAEYTGLKTLFHIHNEETINKQTILKYASEPNLKSLF